MKMVQFFFNYLCLRTRGYGKRRRKRDKMEFKSWNVKVFFFTGFKLRALLFKINDDVG